MKSEWEKSSNSWWILHDFPAMEGFNWAETRPADRTSGEVMGSWASMLCRVRIEITEVAYLNVSPSCIS